MRDRPLVAAGGGGAVPQPTMGKQGEVQLVVNGDVVVATVAGKAALRATAKDFHVRKLGLVVRVGGEDGQDVFVENVKGRR